MLEDRDCCVQNVDAGDAGWFGNLPIDESCETRAVDQPVLRRQIPVLQD
jgi:hypothetical protein